MDTVYAHGEASISDAPKELTDPPAQGVLGNRRAMTRCGAMAVVILAVAAPLSALQTGGGNPATQSETTSQPASAPATQPAVDHASGADQELLGQLISQGKLDDAVAAYGRRPVPGLLIRLGEALRRSGRGLQMLELYQEFIAAPPTNERMSLIESSDGGAVEQMIGTIAEVGHGQDMAKLLADKIAEHPQDVYLRLCLAYLQSKMGNPDQALEELDKCAAVSPTLPVGWFDWAAGLCKQAGLTDRAVAYYQKALATPITEQDIRAGAKRSSMYRPSEVVRSEIRADLLLKLAGIYRSQGRWADAERCYNEVLELKPPVKAEAAQTGLTAVWKAMGKDNALLKQLVEQLQADPNNAAVHAKLAKILLAIGKTQEGIEHYRQAAKLTPAQPLYQLDLADALIEAGRMEEAAAEYSAALQLAARQEPAPGRSATQVSPETVLGRLRRYDSSRNGTSVAPPTAIQDQLLKLYGEALRMAPPATKWKPSEYTIRDLIERMAAILEARSDYAAAVNLWLDHRAQVGPLAREKVQQNLGRLNSLDGMIARLRREVKDNPADIQGQFILGGALLAAGQREQALKTYADLSANHPEDRRLHEDLAVTFSRITGEEARAIQECQIVLRLLPADSEEYTRALCALAFAYRRAGNTQLAAEQFLQALQRDPTNTTYLEGLRDAGGHLPAQSMPAMAATTENEDIALEARAKALLAEGQYAPAIKVLQQILTRRPTDVEAITLLGQTYLKTGQESEAIAAFEKAYDMRRWSPTDYGARSELERLYLKNGADDKLIAIYESVHDYRAIRDLYRNRKQPQKSLPYLLNELDKHPRDIQLRFELVDEHLNNGASDKARSLLDQLKADLEGGASVSRYRLADGYERLNDPAMALTVLDIQDYSKLANPSDSIGGLLMRLLAKTRQMPKAMDVCLVRLRNDPDGYRTLQIAQEIAEDSLANNSVPLLLDFLKQLDGKLPQKIATRFAGAVNSCIQTSGSAGGKTAPITPTTSPVAILRKGRIVPVPATSGTLLSFLDALASSAGTVVDQSYRPMTGQLPAPKLNRKEAPAMELLAEALNGLPVTLELNQQGFWAIFQHGDTTATGCFAASGGALFQLSNNALFRRNRQLVGMGRLIVDPAVKPDVLAISMFPTVQEVVDDHGQKVQIPSVPAKPAWDESGQLSFSIPDQSGSATGLTSITLTAQVAVCTKWITLESALLNAAEPTIIKDQAATVTVEPLRVVESGGAKTWHVHVSIQWNDGQQKLPGTRMHFLTAEGKQLPWSGRSGSGGDNIEVSDLSIKEGAFVPAQTRLVIRLGGAMEVVPVEFHLTRLPIR